MISQSDLIQEISAKLQQAAEHLAIWKQPPRETLVALVSVFARHLDDLEKAAATVPEERQRHIATVFSHLSSKYIDALDSLLAWIFKKSPDIVATDDTFAELPNPDVQKQARSALRFFLDLSEFERRVHDFREGVCELVVEDEQIVFRYPAPIEAVLDAYDYATLSPVELVREQIAKEFFGPISREKINAYEVGEFGLIVDNLWQEALESRLKWLLAERPLGEWAQHLASNLNVRPLSVTAVLEDLRYADPARSVQVHPLIPINKTQVLFVPQLYLGLNPVTNAKRLWNTKYSHRYAELFDRNFEELVRATLAKIPNCVVKEVREFRPINAVGNREHYQIDAAFWHPASASLLLVEAYHPKPPATAREWRNVQGSSLRKARKQVNELLQELAIAANLKQLMTLIVGESTPAPKRILGLLVSAFGHLGPIESPEVRGLSLSSLQRLTESSQDVDQILEALSGSVGAGVDVHVSPLMEPVYLDRSGALADLGVKVGVQMRLVTYRRAVPRQH